ncbi:MAG TPA: hypothetical protein VEU96_18630 [Bryobacteraceae bacterium]|nr:hypothetical protein [Bryobacteraceae bacterium]
MRFNLIFATLLTALASAQVPVATSQYDNARTGANLSETTLTPQNVNAAHFGKLFSLSVEGDVYAQPLYLAGIDIPGKGKHDVVFIATEHDSVYAFDAGGNPSTPLWRVNFLNPGAGITAVPSRDVQCPFIRPEIGITPTPVIDRQTGTLYVLARTKESGGVLGRDRYVQKLHALAITTGAEKFGGPVEIKASVKGRGAGGSNGQIDFAPFRELPRAALLLTNGQVYLTWASSCDVAPYHGWVMAYDAHTLAQTAVFNTSPDAEESGIWQGDTGPAADNNGNVFLITGNGKFDADTGGRDYGDSVLKLALDKTGFQLRDFFTPYNQKALNADDADLGAGGPILLPDQPGPHPHLLVLGGKGGGIYVIDRDHMGKYQPGSDSHAVQMLPFSRGVYSAPAYWNHHLFLFAANDVLKDFAISNGQLSRTPVAQGPTKFIDPGATPTISANGARNGIVWVIRSKGWRSPDTPAVLYAYNAANVANELYNSEQSLRDRAGFCLRFNIPTVANGRVYVGAKGEIDVYGLRSK